MEDALPEEWTILREWLPADLDGLARKHGFMQRARGVQKAEVWLRLILMHVGGGLSLEQTVMRAREIGLANVSAVALFKRLRRAGGWLQSLTEELIANRDVGEKTQEEWMRKVVVVDATDVQEPGTSGSDWRVHYRVRLSDLRCDHYEITDIHEGERLARFKFKTDQIVLADRGYCHRAGAAHVLNAKAHLVVRLQNRVFPLQDKNGRPIDLLAWARTLTTRRSEERSAWFVHEGVVYPIRLCGIRKSRSATLWTQKRQRRKAVLAQQSLRPEAIELGGYLFVLSSLPADEWPTQKVLNLYRYRWQIELVFKRLKSLLGLGHVPKTDDASASAWMQAKILTALLIERALHQARFFSPWGFPLPSPR